MDPFSASHIQIIPRTKESDTPKSLELSHMTRSTVLLSSLLTEILAGSSLKFRKANIAAGPELVMLHEETQECSRFAFLLSHKAEGLGFWVEAATRVPIVQLKGLGFWVEAAY